jgi:tonB-linked outer membrane protein, susC/ragA family
MKKTVFHKIRRLFRFTLLVCLSLGILSAKAQTARVTLKVQNASLGQVMDEIKNQTRYLFINQDVKDLNNHKVSLNVSDKAIAEVLDQIFTPFNIGYRIEKTSIIIFNRPKSTSSSVLIGGKVSDVGGAPIIGATVLVKGTTNGVSTDADGRFTLTIASPATAQLEISYLGYEPQTLAVGNRTSFEITLAESASEIESVVVTALGIKREEKALSYNVQQVEAEDITTVKDANFMNSLTGKVAGVTINASSSGVGGASKVVLRGNKSISQSSNALYVIDGIPMYNFGGGGGTEFDSKGATEAIADINPEDIESISVLTGAAAAALYGSNAANGAVMITTKKGQAGALKVTLSSNTEFLNPFVQPEFQNRYGTGLNGLQSGSAIYSWGEKLAPAARLGYTPDDFFETGHVYTNAVTVSGGTDKNQTYFSAASVNSDGIIPNNEYDRYNFTFRNTSYFLKDKLRLDASASYIYQQDQNMTNQGVYSNPLVPAYLFPRGTNFDSYRIFERYNPASKLMEQFWSDDLEGGDLRMQNPYWIAHRNLRNTDKKRYMLSFSASYDILPWLNVAGRVRIDNANSLYTQKLYASSNTTITDGGKNGHYTEQREYDTQTYADIMVNINKTFGDDWSLQANVGASINNVKIDQLSYRGPDSGKRIAERVQCFRPRRFEEARRKIRLAGTDAVDIRLGGSGLETDALPDPHGP